MRLVQGFYKALKLFRVYGLGCRAWGSGLEARVIGAAALLCGIFHGTFCGDGTVPFEMTC